MFQCGWWLQGIIHLWSHTLKSHVFYSLCVIIQFLSLPCKTAPSCPFICHKYFILDKVFVKNPSCFIIFHVLPLIEDLPIIYVILHVHCIKCSKLTHENLVIHSLLDNLGGYWRSRGKFQVSLQKPHTLEICYNEGRSHTRFCHTHKHLLARGHKKITSTGGTRLLNFWHSDIHLAHEKIEKSSTSKL